MPIPDSSGALHAHGGLFRVGPNFVEGVSDYS